MITIQKAIQVSRNSILKANKIVSDRQFACQEAKRIYKNNARGQYKVLEVKARRTLKEAAKHGLTLEKPYKFESLDEDRRQYLCGMLGDEYVVLR